MVAGLEEITEGELTIGGEVMNDVAPMDRDIAMVFQNYALYPHMTVAGNIGFALKLQKVPKAEARRRVEDAAQLMGLTELLDQKPGQLSGGQRQRVAMGRALVREPVAFLMDEPLSNLDARLRVQMRAEISRLQRRLGVATLYVTHDQTEAMTMGDRVAVLRGGTVRQFDTPQRLYEHPADSHPANLRHPTYWMARDYGLFAANPFGKHYFEKAPDPHAGDYTVPAGGNLTLRYRFFFTRAIRPRPGSPPSTRPTPRPSNPVSPMLTRRTFLKTSALAAAGTAISAKSWSQVSGANGTIRVAVAGPQQPGRVFCQGIQRGARRQGRRPLRRRHRGPGEGLEGLFDYRHDGGVPGPAVPAGHRRRRDRDPESLARAPDDLGLPGREGRLRREARLAHDLGGPAGDRRHRQVRPDRPARGTRPARPPASPRRSPGPAGNLGTSRSPGASATSAGHRSA